MAVVRTDTLPLVEEEEIVPLRRQVRAWAAELGFSLVDQTKLVTAASEIARNTITYGGGGEADLQLVEEGARRGVRLVFRDQGPGMADVELALRDGYTTGSGLGLGLSGAKRLSNEFEVKSAPGEGTTVSFTRWR